MIWGVEAYGQVFRSGGQSDAKPPVFSSRASLVFIDQLKRWKAEITLPTKSLRSRPEAWKHSSTRLHFQFCKYYRFD
ncbi:hypothetical protein TNCV_4735281 [Trichonephila clavipes]|nr:hypothetical protein TNCV_4735281 [Trichonephila clavipes]